MTISKSWAGSLHESQKALIAAGPWTFGGIEPARYEATPDGGERPTCAGCCDICGQSICDVVRLRHATNGETRMIGVDCASTYLTNLGKAFRDAKSGLMKVKREATTRRKAEKLSVVLAPLRAEMTAWAAEDTFRANVARNALRVMDKGRRPSAEHMALIVRLRSEEPRPALPVRKPAPVREEERHVAAPEGAVAVRGVVASVKIGATDYGPTYRMTVKVETPDGSYLVNSTIPRSILDAAWETLECPDGSVEACRGCEVSFSATLTRSDDREHFAFANRPTKGRLVSWPADRARALREEREEALAADPFAALDIAA